MLISNVGSESVIRAPELNFVASEASRNDASGQTADMSVFVTQDIADVEGVWRSLTQAGIESPGQSFDFIRLWIADRRIASEDQRYVVGLEDGEAVVLLPVHRKTVRGMSLFTWFPGTQVGCNSPICDPDRLAAMGEQGRAALWKIMAAQLRGADLLYLPHMPARSGKHQGLFDGLGVREAADTLFRSEFSSWEECDREQRSRSRRKHDRQQGDKLAALGDVAFSEVRSSEEAHQALDIMFDQRSARFRAQGIRDVFVSDCLIGFYHAALRAGSNIDVRLHVLRLDGEIVAVRYNIVHGDRLFCLISSMSDDPRIQAGSPGKQCLLRVMQSVFDDGYAMFDMGAGITDEKRHWCNVQIPLHHHYVGLSWKGRLAASGHRRFQIVRAWAKANPHVKKAVRSFGQWRDRNAIASAAQPESDQL